MKVVAAKAREYGLAGLEFFDGIPGSVGGALRMNAGAMGSAAFEVLVRVRFMDVQGNVHEFDAAKIRADYRSCAHFKIILPGRAFSRGRPEAQGSFIAERSDA